FLSRGVSLGEDLVQHTENGIQTRRQICGVGNLESRIGLAKPLFRTYDSLGYGAFIRQECASDLCRSEAICDPKCQGNLRCSREHGMTAQKDHAEFVVHIAANRLFSTDVVEQHRDISAVMP